MKTPTRLVPTLLATACAGLLAPALAQPADGGASWRFAANELSQERTVKGAPYCAEAVHETVQWLPDPAGAAPNRIVRQSSTRLCRDGEGRTRQEVAQGGRPTVYLRDPVSGEAWLLDAERKTARKLGQRSHVEVEMGYDTSAWREYAERMREWARSLTDRARSHADAAVAVAGAQRAATTTTLSHPTPPTPPSPPTVPTPPTPPTPVIIERDVQVQVLRFNTDADRTAQGAMALPPGVQMRSLSMAPRGPGSLSPLPAKDIEGVRANGERTTWTIEAGKVGNERPIQIVREVWTSPDLMLTLATRDFDPRSGEQNYRLKDLKRGEPDAALFRVPADYTKPATASSRTGRTSTLP